MRIIGVDPGLAKAGVGVVECDARSQKLIHYTAILTKPTLSIQDRLTDVYREFSELVEEYGPDVCAMESLFFAKNAASAFKVGQARGVFILAAAHAGVDVIEYTPLQVKKAVVGYGKAKKEQVQYMVQQAFGLSAPPQPADAADAIAIALCHSQMFKMAALGVAPGSRRKRASRGFRGFDVKDGKLVPAPRNRKR